MAVKSSLVYSAIGLPSPECWSSTGWEHESLPTDSWDWEDPNSSYSTRQGQQSSAEWASVTVASSFGASKSDDESSPVYALGTSATSVSSGIQGVARGSESSTVVKNETNESLFFRSLSREREDGSSEEPQGGQKSSGSNSSEGENVGLKLGRRTYLEDSGKQGGESLALSPPGKKQRPLSPNSLAPKCQVEGCKADLSRCKDYHKRHKVCEMHSKEPKAIVGGIEQRFCQQCSRFHVLKEFDEGKRSCRRRLAGHNERRRKPPPETHTLFGLGNPFPHRGISTSTMGAAHFYFPDIKPSTVSHPHRGSLLDYGIHSYGHSLNRASPWSLKSRSDNIPTFLMQNPKTPMATLKPTPGLHILEGSLGPLGQGLSLSSSTGGMLGNMEQRQQQQQSHCSQSLSSVSGMMDSDRALSLLSSQSWASRPPLTTSVQQTPSGLSQAGDSTLEHLVASSNESSNRGGSRFSHQLPGEGSSSSAHFGNKQFSMHTVDSGGLNFGLTATGTGTTHERGGCNNMLAGFGGYDETNSMLALVRNGQDHGRFGSSHQARATMDLMQTVHNNGVHSQVYNNGFSSFESSRFSNQQLL